MLSNWIGLLMMDILSKIYVSVRCIWVGEFDWGGRGGKICIDVGLLSY